MALDVPDGMLGAGQKIGVWATVGLPRDGGGFAQLDRAGHPTINPFINPDYAKEAYNAGHPALRPSASAVYPDNGRHVTDGVFTLRMAFLSNGAVTSGAVPPHADLRPDFPYLGPPNPNPAM